MRPAPVVQLPDCQLNWEALGKLLYTGRGTPNGVLKVSGPAMYLRLDNAPGSTFYVHTDPTASTAWSAVA